MEKKRWTGFGFGFSCLFALILCSGIRVCFSLNDEGLLLIAFRLRITSDPFAALENWNPTDVNPCLWSAVDCVNGKVQMLNMTGLALEGTLAPEIGRLNHLTTLVLCKNHFSGEIPEEIGELKMLELLDLRDNKFSGPIPDVVRTMQSLKYLLLSGFQSDDYLESKEGSGISDMSREFGQSDSLHSTGYNSFDDSLQSLSQSTEVQSGQKLLSFARRRLLQASNLPAVPASRDSTSSQVVAPPITRSSGSFRAVPHPLKRKPAHAPLHSPTAAPTHHPNGHHSNYPNDFSVNPTSRSSSSGNLWKYMSICGGLAVLLVVAAAMFCMCRSKAVATIGPWKTGLSGQLQKAFITGVPKLNHGELETACEDFSNIIVTNDVCTTYKGTLSSGVEIAVASTNISAFKDWTKTTETLYRKKIDTLSRVNHKNFVNLIGYCEEDEPFVRMMVFEYAPNGSLFEHLHVKEVEPLDWSARMRVVMGASYCLQYMHHDLNPPVVHPSLSSTSIYLTDDYAAKVAIMCFSPPGKGKSKNSSEEDKESSILPPSADSETNVYCFGILLLEIISGKLPYTEEQGSLVNWAVEYLNDRRSISYMIDPSLTSFKNNELDVICEVIQDCIQPDPRQRPTMKEITSKLRDVIGISPDQATPRLSPLWWAELEILSVEAT